MALEIPPQVERDRYEGPQESEEVLENRENVDGVGENSQDTEQGPVNADSAENMPAVENVPAAPEIPAAAAPEKELLTGEHLAQVLNGDLNHIGIGNAAETSQAVDDILNMGQDTKRQ